MQKRFVHKPSWITGFEERVGRAIPVHPNLISLIKLLIITPAIYFSLKQVDILPHSKEVIIALFLAFCLLDYLDGIVARARKQFTKTGKILDRVTDYPLLILIAWQCKGILPIELLTLKVALDLLLLGQFIAGKGTTENRIRATISYTLLILMLMLSQGWASKWLTSESLTNLLIINIAFTASVFLYNLGFLGRKRIADLLSLSNLICGVFSIWFAYQGKFVWSLLCLLLGAVFDGMDGAAARKYGGSRFGVYADDIADGVNYGIAPACAIYFLFSDINGLIVGSLFAIFTLSRLVFFTLDKSSDPEYFKGVPSTIGGLIVLCGIIVFPGQPLLLGLLIGIAAIQMVSFDTLHRHLGRALGSGKKRYLFGLPALGICVLLTGLLTKLEYAIAGLLLIVLAYGFAPVFRHFKNVVYKKS